MTELSELSFGESARHYRELAKSAVRKANTAKLTDVRDCYEMLARQWDELASEIERRSSAPKPVHEAADEESTKRRNAG